MLTIYNYELAIWIQTIFTLCAIFCIELYFLMLFLLFSIAVCRLPVDKGSCEGSYHKRWYFDDEKGECLAFIYTGCGSNFNNFKSYQSCIEFCGELLPQTEPRKLERMYQIQSYHLLISKNASFYIHIHNAIVNILAFLSCKRNKNDFYLCMYNYPLIEISVLKWSI